jgi:hypothetical protein
MIESLKQDCTRLNERQGKIIQLFGKLVKDKYEITRGHDPLNGERREAEVFIDIKWKPLVAFHCHLETLLKQRHDGFESANTSISLPVHSPQVTATTSFLPPVSHAAMVLSSLFVSPLITHSE